MMKQILCHSDNVNNPEDLDTQLQARIRFAHRNSNTPVALVTQ